MSKPTETVHLSKEAKDYTREEVETEANAGAMYLVPVTGYGNSAKLILINASTADGALQDLLEDDYEDPEQLQKPFQVITKETELKYIDDEGEKIFLDTLNIYDHREITNI